jgi:hypothetical protein
MLQSENSSDAMLSRLWSAVRSLASPSTNLTTYPGLPSRLNLTIELQIRHPFAYPPAPYIDLGDTQGPLGWLTQATRGVNILQSDPERTVSLDDDLRPETTLPHLDPTNFDDMYAPLRFQPVYIIVIDTLGIALLNQRLHIHRRISVADYKD